MIAPGAVDITCHDGMVRATLRRPERGNALDEATVESLIEALERAATDGTQAFVIEGAGRHFCTGFDLPESGADDAHLLYRLIRIELMLQLVYGAPFVTMAFAHGSTFGAGADLFVACDRRVVAGEATFSFPGAGFGILLGTARLAERVGTDVARRLVRTGDAIGTPEALRINLANEEASSSDVDAFIARSIRTAIASETLAGLHRVTKRVDGDTALAELVRSAARPGLAERLAAYRERVKARRTPP